MPSQPGDTAVGAGAYVADAGDCVASIADAHGLFWQTIWDHPDNEALKKARGNPNILRPGDRVSIPPIEVKNVVCATGSKHVFRRRGVPEILRVVLADAAGQPFAGKRYRLVIGGAEYTGNTGSDGLLSHWVPTRALGATLQFWPETEGLAETIEWSLLIGYLDPPDTMAGIRTRLTNLGFRCGTADPADDGIDELTRAALSAFQTAHGLTESGEPDEATRKKLAEVHER